uniref:Uncharacterized protein n=1 Tax=Strigamia maritima TaxID=126957 RepID=T1J9P1_STRMM
MADNSNCSVFIGNIPHDATEDQLFVQKIEKFWILVNEATKKERGPSVDTPLRESPLEGAVDPTEYITRVVASMPPEEMIAFVMEIKELDENHPIKAPTNMQVLRDLNNFDPELSNQSNQPPPVYKLQPLDVDTFSSSRGRYTFDPENKDPRLRPRTQLKARRRTQNK